MSAVLLRALRYGGLLCACWVVISCGGSNGGGNLGAPSTMPVTPADNVVTAVVDGGPSGTATNLLYTTVTVCVPGSTTNCQTIDHIQVDTGSSGLRLLASALTLQLPVVTTATGASLVECFGFIDGFVWGPVALVDMQISGESAGSVPVHLVGDSRFPNVPTDCSSIGPPENTVAAFGANGILGIGFLPQDCGSICVSTPVPQAYYSCTAAAAATCQATTVALSSQVPNPVTMFMTDNNGTIIGIPSVPLAGAATVSGSLIFGIDTQSNNASSGQTVLFVNADLSDPNYGDLTTNFNGQALTASFIDSGSNGLYFNDSALPACAQPNTEFYCPANTPSYTATLQGISGPASSGISFSVASADSQPANITAYPGLAGTNSTANSFDWGLAFFYGRRVTTAIQGYTTSAGMGPYVAFE